MSVTESGGKIHSASIIFRREMFSDETVRFRNRRTQDTMLVDRGDDGYPVAVQMIFAAGLSTVETAKGAEELDLQRALFNIFMFATEMLRYREFRKSKQGNALVPDAVEQLRHVNPSQLVAVS